MKNVWLMVIAAVFMCGCDQIVKDKYLSSDQNACSVKEIVTPFSDEAPILPAPLKHKQCIVIPEQFKQKITISLNENVPIKSVLSNTARTLGIDFQMGHDIDSKVIFQAKDKPFIEVLDAVCDMADLRYSINGSIIKVVKDTPFSKSYDIQFLNFQRDSENKISIATEVSSSQQIEQSNSPTQQTDSSVTVKTQTDFWSELENGIRIILTSNAKPSGNTNESDSFYINKQSGVITVCCDSKTHNQIAEYVERIKEAITSQVLIEAKIIEVTLKNEYKRGIDWSILGKHGTGDATRRTVQNFKFPNIDSTSNAFTATINTGSLTAVLRALEEFGSMRTISNPRITTMNNQAAVIKVAQNYVYFKMNYDKTYSSNDRESEFASSDVRVVPIGLVMFVQPSIDLETGTVTMFLRPTLSKLSDTVNDPAVDIIAYSKKNDDAKAQALPTSKIPITEIREIASVLKLNDGEVAVLGGFMEVKSGKNKQGLPIIGDAPVIGEAFSSLKAGDTVTELVILIKVNIMNDRRCQRAADIRLQRFVPDPRPFL